MCSSRGLGDVYKRQKGDRVGLKIEEGRKVRIFKSNGKEIDE